MRLLETARVGVRRFRLECYSATIRWRLNHTESVTACDTFDGIAKFDFQALH